MRANARAGHSGAPAVTVPGQERHERARQLEACFFSLRPELRRPAGAYGVQVALDWLRAAGRRAPRHGGEVFWHVLFDRGWPEGQDPCVIVDAIVGFVAFAGSRGCLPAAAAQRLRRQARIEGLAFAAMTMGLLSPRQVDERRRRCRPG